MDALLPDVIADRAAQLFRALSEPNRLRIVNLLHVEGEMSVGDIAEALGSSQANVSRHLRVMLDSGLVARRAEATSAYYRLAGPFVETLCTLVCDQIRSDVLQQAGALAGTTAPGGAS